MPLSNEELKLAADTIRTLSIDAVEKAKSGHPGMAMGCAEIAAVLWGKVMNYNPEDPQWPGRDRFILSAGHGSMLLYSALHLAGYEITIDDIKNFRQLGSITPGHPEHCRTSGVETTTGPLGQGFANGVGMAIANKLLQEDFGDLVKHYIYAIISDGDIMEGLSAEAASLAGHMGLGNLIYIYDSNEISIEGSTDLAFSEDAEMRFKACNWHVQTIDGHNLDEIQKAVKTAQKETNMPSLIIAKTAIAKGSPGKEGSADSHGAPLGEDEIKATKKNIGWDENSSFYVPEKVYSFFKKRNSRLREQYDLWQIMFKRDITGEKKKIWDDYFSPADPEQVRSFLPAFEHGTSIATRSASGKILETLFEKIPGIAGGSADLGPSNKSFVKGYSNSGRNKVGRNIHFGIREHAMGAIQNGIAYYGGFIPYTASFLSFMDYMRPAVRIAAIAKLQTVYIFTHDSIFVGEDGPTHQPVEHLASARAIPNLNVIRPADAEETKEAWIAALKKTNGPTMLSLTRQDVPVIKKEPGSGAENLHKGAYIIHKGGDKPDIIILSTGSEVGISVDAAVKLKEQGITVRVVSFPCWELFDEQSDSYRKEILPEGVPVAVVEAGLKMGWEKYAGNSALYITVEKFGVSAPWKVLAEEYGINSNNIVNRVIEHLN